MSGDFWLSGYAMARPNGSSGQRYPLAMPFGFPWGIIGKSYVGKYAYGCAVTLDMPWRIPTCEE